MLQQRRGPKSTFLLADNKFYANSDLTSIFVPDNQMVTWQGSLNKTTHKWQQWQFKHGMQIQVSGVTHDVWLHNTLHAQCPLKFFLNDWSLLCSEQSVLMLPIILWQIRLILPSVMYYVLLCVVVNKLTLCIYILIVCRHADIIQCCNDTIFPLQSLTTNQTNQVFVERIILNLIIFLGIITEKCVLWEHQTVYRITPHRTFIQNEAGNTLWRINKTCIQVISD